MGQKDGRNGEIGISCRGRGGMRETKRWEQVILVLVLGCLAWTALLLVLMAREDESSSSKEGERESEERARRSSGEWNGMEKRREKTRKGREKERLKEIERIEQLYCNAAKQHNSLSLTLILILCLSLCISKLSM